MLLRTIEKPIREFLQGPRDKVLVVKGARQIGKSYIIRHVAKSIFHNYVEINLVEDKEGERQFVNVHTVEDFYLRLSLIAGDKLHSAIDSFVATPDYGIKEAVVVSNSRKVEQVGNITHIPIYYTPFLT